MTTKPNKPRIRFKARFPDGTVVRTDGAPIVVKLLASHHRLLKAQEPMVERDTRRQAGTRKPRRQEIHERIDAWIREALGKQAPRASRKELYRLAPEWLRKDLGYHAFLKRVSTIREQMSR